MALHEQSVERGDKVTIVRLSDTGIICGRVIGHDTDGLILVDCGSDAINFRVAYSDKGIRWISGHVRDGTPAVEALLAAFKLSKMLE